MNTRLRSVWVWVICGSLIACQGISLETQSGSMESIRMEISLQGDTCDVIAADATVTARDMAAVGPVKLTIMNTAIQGRISQIPAGTSRQVLVNAYNASGKVVYSGSTQVDVSAGQVASASLVLRRNAQNCPITTPNTGAINISGTLESSDEEGQTCGHPEVHVFGTYEASGDHTRTGEATVRVERTGSQVLVLSSYRPVRWKVSAVSGADIQYILALGYYAQSVEAPPGVAVKVLDFESKGQFVGCAYEYPDDDPHSGCETPDLLAKVKDLTGQEVSSFHGCYQATSFTLHSDLSANSSCPNAPGGDYNLSGLVNPVCTGSGPTP